MYALYRLYNNDVKLGQIDADPKCNVGLVMDITLAVSMLVLSILVCLAHVYGIPAFKSFYPIGAYLLLGISVGWIAMDALVFFAKRKEKEEKELLANDANLEMSAINQKKNLVQSEDQQLQMQKIIINQSKSFTSEPLPSATNLMEINSEDQLNKCWSSLKEYLKLTAEEQGKKFTDAEVVERFRILINKAQEKQFYLNTLIPKYIAWHFDISIDIVQDIIFDKDHYLSNDAILACIEKLEIFAKEKAKEESQSGLFLLEKSLKQKVKEKYQKDHNTAENTSPISMSSWEEIPLLNLLILSDGCFYDLTSNSSDLVYLKQQLGENGLKKAPKGSKFIDNDSILYEKKIKRLGFSEQQTCHIKEANHHDPAPFRSIENLIMDLINSPANGNLQQILVPYLDDLGHSEIQNLCLPNLNFLPLREVDFYRFKNRHVLAIYLWNALKQTDYPLGPPSAHLLSIALYQKIPLKQ